MHTYIFSRDIEETPRMFDLVGKTSQAMDCITVAGILFGMESYVEPRHLTIPTIQMWVGHELAFLEYTKVVLDDLHAAAVATGERNSHKFADSCKRNLGMIYDDAWKNDSLAMTNPIATVSDNFIHQNWVEFFRGRPDCATLRPDIVDLSVPFKYDWNI